MPNLIRKNAIWILAGNGVFSISQWFNIIVLSHIGGAAEVGKFAFALAVTAPVILFFNLSLRALLVTDANNNFAVQDYIKLRYITCLTYFVIILLLCYLFPWDGEQKKIIIIIAIAKVFESISDIHYGMHQKTHRLDYISKSLIFRGIFGLISFSFIFYFTHNLVTSAIAYAVAWGISLWLIDIKGPANQWHTKDFLLYSKIAKTALPLGIAALLVSFNWNIPRYFIEKFLNKEDLGVFCAIVYLVVIGNMVINSVGQSINVHLAEFYAKNNMQKFIRYTFKATLFALGIGLCGIVLSTFIGQYIIIMLYGKTFSQHTDILILISIGATITYITSILGHAITSARRFKNMLLPYVIVTLSVTYASAFLIPQYGLKGAAYTFICFGFVDLLAHLFLFWQICEGRKI